MGAFLSTNALTVASIFSLVASRGGFDLLRSLYCCVFWQTKKKKEKKRDLKYLRPHSNSVELSLHINCFSENNWRLNKEVCLFIACLVYSNVDEEQVLGVNDSLRGYFDLSY